MTGVSGGVFPTSKTADTTANLSQPAGTYDLATASADLLIETASILVTTAGSGFTRVSIETNDATPFAVLSSGDGAVANLTAGRQLQTTWHQGQPILLRAGQKLQYTIQGATGVGALRCVFQYRPLSGGALV
jgi:hypothetical protein